MQLEEILRPIRDDLAQTEAVIAQRTEASVPTITQVVRYVIQNGGKRIRPALTILAAHLAGYTGTAAAKVGAAMEMVHTASLLHDDVIDNAPTRRGRLSANSKWGNQISVLVGDFFWCKACEIIVDLGDHRILRTITDAIVGTTEGEMLDLTTSNDLEIREAEYLKIVQHKTAMLFAASGQVGAMLGGVAEPLEHAVRRYGLELGVAFQLADDALDYVADPARSGKPQGTDLREGRITLPLIIAFQRCSAADQTLVKNAVLSPALSETQLAAVTRVLNDCGSIAYTLDLARTYVARAKTHLAPFQPSPDKEVLLQLAEYVASRDS